MPSQARPRPPQADRGQAVPRWCECEFTASKLMAMTLNDIRADRERTLVKAMKRRPEAELRRSVETLLAAKKPHPQFTAALSRPGGPHLIAEIKKASPSAGLIRADYQPAEIARAYATGGASAISVLTEPTVFQGSLDHLREVRAAVQLPILRKDFIFHHYQLLEAVESGADAILLIVAMLTPDELRSLHEQAQALRLDCLIEVHDESEMQEALKLGAKLIGINNRNLKTMRVDIETTFRLLPKVSKGVTVVSESGIRSRADVERLGKAGVNAILVGEALMRSADPGAAASALLGKSMDRKKGQH